MTTYELVIIRIDQLKEVSDTTWQVYVEGHVRSDDEGQGLSDFNTNNWHEDKEDATEQAKLISTMLLETKQALSLTILMSGNEIFHKAKDAKTCPEWKIVEGHCAERTCNGERVAFIEKTPRVKNPLTGEWEEGPKGAGGSGVDGVNGGYQPSRDWADTKLIEFGYTLENTSILTMAIDGNKYWLKNNVFHRETAPAIELRNGIKYWCRDGQLHREDGPAIEYPDGGQEWHQNGQLHRLDGPAMSLSNGHEEWYVNGKKHREDGPAVIHPSGHRGFWINGKSIDKET